MKKLVCFLIVGLVFTVLQSVTVEAQAPLNTPPEPGMAPPTGEPGMAPPAGEPGMAPPAGEPGMAPPAGEPGMAPPAGDPGMAPSRRSARRRLGR